MKGEIIKEVYLESLLEQVPEKVRNYLEKEYKPLSPFIKKPAHVDGLKRVWKTEFLATEEYDLDSRVQSKLRPGRISILKDLRLLKEFFSEDRFVRFLGKKGYKDYASEHFKVVYDFFSENKLVSVFHLEKSVESLICFIESIRTRMLVEEFGSTICK